ncbi:MAG: hypothetical protein EOL88_08360 [Bacteroidia bacterium]|nr:hypothetical protein [Bacteroidia bacterium]
MKIAAISDLHFHNWKDYSKIEDGVNTRFNEIKKTVVEAYNVAKLNRCDFMCVSGDVFHVRGTLKTSVLNNVVDLFARLSVEIPTIMITGNHDMESYRYDEFGSAIRSIRGKNIYIVDGVVNAIYSVYKEEYIKVGGIQYHHNIDEFKEKFEEMLQSTNPEIVMIHQGIDDFRPSLTVPETKLTASYFKSVFDKYDKRPYILCGHYHKPGRLDSIINVGAPLQHTFGGAGQERGMFIVDLSSDSVTFNPLNVSPKFYVLDEKKLKDIDDLDSFLKSNYVKIKTSSMKALEKIAKKHTDVDIASLRIEIEKEFKGSYDVSIGISGVEEMLNQYLKDVLLLDESRIESLLKTYNRVVYR